ncbi:MAG: DUF924 domain-containing protein [Paracoccaceae bacterium]|nr:DUF924 domain-containing protein [Paracoccaceae bacterium]MDG2258319.1 DUF924 domain-containing protein [Paracoccaceae bacterium]
MGRPEEVLSFWLDEAKQSDWYMGSEAFDQEIRDRFMGTWEEVQKGNFGLWLTYPTGTLAYIILTDQFPRNMFRNDGRSFKTDRMALTAAKAAIHKKWDLRIDEPARQFFYMPLMHSESLCDQDRCVRLMMKRLPEGGPSSLLHAQAHREVIRQFGRFPYRNDALERKFTSAERGYIEAGGYSHTVQDLQAVVV